MSDKKIIFFLKYPQLGKVKSRLAADIGKQKAFEIYNLLLNRSWEIILQTNLPVNISYTPPGFQDHLIEMFGAEHGLTLQEGKDIGIRMAKAFQQVFNSDVDRSVLIGSDLPELDKEILIDAFTQLENFDAVIGPSADGGYYLIGFNRNSFKKAIFEDINWSTEHVYQQTLKKIRYFGLSLYILPVRNDIDTFDDVKLFLNENKKKSEFAESLDKIVFGEID